MTAPEVRWETESDLVVDDVRFRVASHGRFASTEERFCLVKRPDLVEQYREMLSELAPKRIVELGVLQGGSTALLALLSQPEKLVAFEFDEERIAPLDQLIARRDLGDSVRIHYGVDQSDTETLRRLVDEEFGAAELDLVIDDASHEVEQTEASFNVLFPRLRCGGLYIVEDWSWAHFAFGAHRPDVEPLTTFVFEALVTLPQPRGLIDEVRVVRDWAVIR